MGCGKERFRGQAATEYLIIVAIVVVVALIAVSSISGFPSLISGTSKGRSADFWSRADIAVTAYSLSGDGSAVLLVKNRKGYAVELQAAQIGGREARMNARLAPGEVKKIEMAAGSLEGGAQGSEYSKPVAFRYADVEEPGVQLNYAPDMPLVGTYE